MCWLRQVHLCVLTGLVESFVHRDDRNSAAVVEGMSQGRQGHAQGQRVTGPQQIPLTGRVMLYLCVCCL